MSLPETPGKDPTPPHHPHSDGTLDGGADPLLQSGAFIDAAAAMEKSQSNGVTSNGSTPDGLAGRAKAKGSDPMPMNWLPAGWSVEYKVRTSGATAGCTDRYYYDPDSGRRFRSKKEVIRFLETGTGTLKKSTDSDKTSVEGSPSKKQKKSSTKPRPAVNFDFFDVPAKVEWVLTDSSHWTWTPFIGDQKVTESTAEEWATAFTVFTSYNSGCSQ